MKQANKKEVFFYVRVSKETKDAFSAICEEREIPAAVALRKLIMDEIRRQRAKPRT